MRKLPILTLLAASSFTTSCNRDKTVCITGPLMSEFQFRLKDKDNNDLFETGRYSRVGISAWQPCDSAKREVYVSTTSVITFNDLQTDPAECVKLYVKWGNGDVDTLAWAYNNNTSPKCFETLKSITFNGAEVIDKRDGGFVLTK